MASLEIQIWLLDIRGEIAGIRDVAVNKSLDEFSDSWMMRRAVEHALLIIAEAAKHIPDQSKAEHPEVPWQRIHGLGNLLRHEYRRIDPVILWSVISDHLDELDVAVAKLLQKLQRG